MILFDESYMQSNLDSQDMGKSLNRELAADSLGSTVGMANYSLCISYSEMWTNLNCMLALPNPKACTWIKDTVVCILSKMTQSNFDPWLGDDDMV